MNTAGAFRDACEHARKIKVAQDNFIAKATLGDWAGLSEYPEDLQWEALVDVLRGRVKVCPRALFHVASAYQCVVDCAGPNTLLGNGES